VSFWYGQDGKGGGMGTMVACGSSGQTGGIPHYCMEISVDVDQCFVGFGECMSHVACCHKDSFKHRSPPITTMPWISCMHSHNVLIGSFDVHAMVMLAWLALSVTCLG